MRMPTPVARTMMQRRHATVWRRWKIMTTIASRSRCLRFRRLCFHIGCTRRTNAQWRREKKKEQKKKQKNQRQKSTVIRIEFWAWKLVTNHKTAHEILWWMASTYWSIIFNKKLCSWFIVVIDFHCCHCPTQRNYYVRMITSVFTAPNYFHYYYSVLNGAICHSFTGCSPCVVRFFGEPSHLLSHTLFHLETLIGPKNFKIWVNATGRTMEPPQSTIDHEIEI